MRERKLRNREVFYKTYSYFSNFSVFMILCLNVLLREVFKKKKKNLEFSRFSGWVGLKKHSKTRQFILLVTVLSMLTICLRYCSMFNPRNCTFFCFVIITWGWVGTKKWWLCHKIICHNKVGWLGDHWN